MRILAKLRQWWYRNHPLFQSTIDDPDFAFLKEVGVVSFHFCNVRDRKTAISMAKYYVEKLKERDRENDV